MKFICFFLFGFMMYLGAKVLWWTIFDRPEDKRIYEQQRQNEADRLEHYHNTGVYPYWHGWRKGGPV